MRTNENIGFHSNREWNCYPINHTNTFQEKEKPIIYKWVTETTLLGQKVNKVNINVSRL